MSQNFPEVNFSESGKHRYLHLGTPWIQGAMLVDKPFDIDLEYVQRMMAWLLFVPDLAQVKSMHAMQLGLGAAALTKFCFKKLKMQTTAIELNPQVIAVCRQWFKLPADDARLKVLQADAIDYIYQDKVLDSVDALQVDMYDDDAACPVLDSYEYYAQCRKLLTDDGCMTVNLFGRDSSFDSSLDKIVDAFLRDENISRGEVWTFRPTKEGNTIVLARRNASACSHDMQVRAAEIESRFDLPAKKWLKAMRKVEG